MPLTPIGRPSYDKFSYTSCVSNGAVLENVERRESRGDRNGIAAKCGRMCARFPVHHIRLGNHCAQWHARSDSFCGAKNVGFDPGVVDSPPFARASHSTLHFVG